MDMVDEKVDEMMEEMMGEWVVGMNVNAWVVVESVDISVDIRRMGRIRARKCCVVVIVWLEGVVGGGVWRGW